MITDPMLPLSVISLYTICNFNFLNLVLVLMNIHFSLFLNDMTSSNSMQKLYAAGSGV